MFFPINKSYSDLFAAPKTNTYLMECKTVGTNPGVFDAVLTVMKNFAGELLVRIVTRLLADAVKPRLLQQLRKPIRLLALLLRLQLLGLRLSLGLHALRLRHLQRSTGQPISERRVPRYKRRAIAIAPTFRCGGRPCG